MFANPIFLFALLGGAVPIVVHLIFRRKRTGIEYPTLMFFKRVDMKLASRRKIKEVVLLILRALAVMLLALALARPSLQGNAGGSASADSVLVLDNSASMGLNAGVGTRLDFARTRAASVLSLLGAEGRAALLTVVPSDAVTPVSSLTGDRDLLNKALTAIAPSNGAGSLAGAIRQAGEVLAKSSSATNREVFIFTDMQGHAFKDDQALKKATEALPPRTRLFLCAAPGGGSENNLGIAAVSLDPRPKVAGRSIALSATIKNYSKHEQTASVSATLKDQAAKKVSIALQGGASQTVSFALPLGQEGFTSGEVRLDNDDVAYDNVWPFCVQVRGPIRILLISPSAAKSEQDQSFYLGKALDPTGDGRLTGMKVIHVAQQNAPQGSLENYDVVIVAGCYALSPGTLKSLNEYADRGGGLMIFAGDRDAPLSANHPLQSLLGGQIEGELIASKTQTALGLRAVNEASPFFDDARNTDGRVDFHEVSIVKALKVRAGHDTSVLAEFTNGHPALLLHGVGKGRVLWWTVSGHADDSNMPLSPSFLPLLHGAVAVLANAQSQALERRAGQPLILDLSAAKSVPAALNLYDPDERLTEIPVENAQMNWRMTGRSGVYRIEPKAGDSGAGAKGPKQGAGIAGIPSGFAVTPDPDESLPEYVSTRDALRALSADNAFAVDAGTDLLPLLAQARQGRELFGIFIMAAFFMVLAEALLANMLGTRMKPPSKNKPEQTVQVVRDARPEKGLKIDNVEPVK